MASPVTSVAAAPARTPVPPPETPSAGKGGGPAGNASPLTGGRLPLERVVRQAAGLEEALQRLIDLADQMQRSLRFRVDEASGRTVITVLDAETKEVIRQIPPAEWLAVIRNLRNAGMLLDARG